MANTEHNVRITLIGGTDTRSAADQAARDAACAALVGQCLAAAEAGNADALFDLAVAFSTGSHGVEVDLVEAHKWFNLAAVGGHDEAAQCRADISDEMTAREIAEAQRRAREWMRASPARRVA
jgi:TPR repeat protein